MEDILNFFGHAFTTHFVQVAVVSIFAAVSWFAKRILNYYKQHIHLKEIAMEKEIKEQELIKEGLLALLRYRINKSCAEISEKEYMTPTDKFDLQDLYKAYESLGGNSRTKILYEHIMNDYKTIDDKRR